MAIPEGGAECLEPGDVSRQFEYSENPQDPEDLGCLGNVAKGVLRVQKVHEKRQEERKNPHQVNHIQERHKKYKLEKNFGLDMQNLVKTFTL